MTEDNLRAKLSELGVTPPDVLRSALYLDYLQKTRRYLTQTLDRPAPKGLGGDYEFLRGALGSANLLNELAQLLDRYVGAAVQADMEDAYKKYNTRNYESYFLDVILNDAFHNNVERFKHRFPATAFALRKLTKNFKTNICKVCQRIVADRKDIEKLFDTKYSGLMLIALQRIESTGSDFHKGGQQVMILTFSSSYWEGGKHLAGDFKLVYKPSDLEADCLLTGNSAALNDVMKNFMSESLVEIFNWLVRQGKKDDPHSSLEELRTYLILPRNHTSRHPAETNPIPVRNAYGYLEFLGYDYPAVRLPFNDSFGSLMILHEETTKPLIQAFYRRLGQCVALASTFSFTDMHIENVRVNDYMPFMIDLEVSLTVALTDVSATLCFGDIGGITAESVKAGDVWQLTEDKEMRRHFLEKHDLIKRCQNRLWAFRPAWGVVKVDHDCLLAGFDSAMDLLGRGAKEKNRFDRWFDRLQRVLVRYVPIATIDFQNIRDLAFVQVPRGRPADILQYELESAGNREFFEYEIEFKEYVERRREVPPQPNFLAITPEVVLNDFLALDIPAFYHRIGSTHIVNSQGSQVLIPTDKRIKISDTEERNLPNTFFPGAPTEVNVRQAQFGPLGDAERRNQRKTMLTEQIREQLGLGGIPQNADAFIR